MFRWFIALALAAAFSGCSSTPDGDLPPGTHGCETFFIWVLCVADQDMNGNVDYMYFDDTREIFMYDEPIYESLQGVQPFHPCAIPIDALARDYATQLLYDDDLRISQRLGLKGKLIGRFRASEPVVGDCLEGVYGTGGGKDDTYNPDKDPFLDDEDWAEEIL